MLQFNQIFLQQHFKRLASGKEILRKIIPHLRFRHQRQPLQTIEIRAPAIGQRQRIVVEWNFAPAGKELLQLRELTRFADDFGRRQHGRNIHAILKMQIQMQLNQNPKNLFVIDRTKNIYLG